MLKIALASDHAGFALKNAIIQCLKEKNYETIDFGCFSGESCDYPDYAHPLAFAVENDSDLIGIVCCGSGNGINMTVNKHQGIRSAICWNDKVAELARSHNNANVCSLPARFLSIKKALEIVHIFLNTDFEGGRHLTRINKIPIE
ncbi:MAG: ribose 5-phosphate isomerase B [Ignavibacteriaceae bacterium]|jgi:ribose 5-phosphate isomerase B|nr:ribose 5-phosphate isomerase B [Ignavibacteriaceae bacterium]